MSQKLNSLKSETKLFNVTKSEFYNVAEIELSVVA